MISCYKAATSTILTMEELFPSFTLPFLINLPVLHYPFYFASPTACYVRGKGLSLREPQKQQDFLLCLEVFFKTLVLLNESILKDAAAWEVVHQVWGSTREVVPWMVLVAPALLRSHCSSPQVSPAPARLLSPSETPKYCCRVSHLLLFILSC